MINAIKVSKIHTVEYVNGYYLLRTHDSNDVIKDIRIYISLESMILRCGFKMGFNYADAALESKERYINGVQQ